ncbi:MAG: ORF6N domain-containing protein [Candidatus Euphemobacter frigidus]|nr:ORF6N domain-containing protein [Candidatus Euphemobacter frigidus]
MANSKSIVKVGKIQQRILLIRGEKVIIDADLAEAYGVPTRRLNEQVRRNLKRFPGDFMFQLTSEEKAEVIANCDHLEKLKFSKALPLAFTEHGAIMAASVLNSQKAVEVSVFVVRAFVQLREVLAGHKEIARKISQLERKLGDHDQQIMVLIEAIKQLMDPKLPPKTRRIGFSNDCP